ncbi:Developmental regulator flbA [Cladobotryum mycophilum]|uniref:Developmental regulator flbA n=1 Tax=Cladobotryum mycophilum TaxID=491253 RepID=A0ABR0S7W9_9HYPO
MAVLSQPLSLDPLPLPTRQQPERSRPYTTPIRNSSSIEHRFPDSAAAAAAVLPASSNSIHNHHSHSHNHNHTQTHTQIQTHAHTYSPRRHASSNSTSTLPRPQRSASGILSLAAAALDRTQSAIANLSEPVIRPLHSHSSVGSGRHTQAPHSTFVEPIGLNKINSFSDLSSHSQISSSGDGRQTTFSSPTSSANSSPTQTLSDSSSHLSATAANKMHQTSSRLLRMTDDDRPFTRDFNDLFSTLIVSLLPLSAHRVRLSKVEYTFLSEDAINNLGSLKFSQSNRMPDPKDPSRIVTTTTTTTFSMAKDMARSICQRFVEARFIESADGKYQQIYTMKGSVWQLTPKGISILDRFCAKNGIQQKQVAELAGTNSAQLVILERDQQTDKLLNDWGTIEVIFRRFVGAEGRNIKASVTAADSDSLHDYKDGLTGVKMAAERKVNGKVHYDTFTGKAASDWLMDCSTIVDRREAYEIASLFVEHDLMEPVVQDRTYSLQHHNSNLFQPTKHAVYKISLRGKDIINGNNSRGRTSESEGTSSHRNGVARDSNTQRLDRILNDPALRLLFRENLRDTHCEENLSFYKDVNEFVCSCKTAIELAEKTPTTNTMDAIKEIMAQAYGIYNAFLAPGSPCELNIDHQLRNNLATRMTKAVGQESGMIETLREVTTLFEDAQNAVFKLMASDSVPKFLRNVKYEQQLRNFEVDSVTSAPRGLERSQSRSNRT